MTQDSDEQRDSDESGALVDGEEKLETGDGQSKRIRLSFVNVAWGLSPGLSMILLFAILERIVFSGGSLPNESSLGLILLAGFLISYVWSVGQLRFRYRGLEKYLQAVFLAVSSFLINLIVIMGACTVIVRLN
jgi:uncharacterized membrane protein